jgi:hypothetical protein
MRRKLNPIILVLFGVMTVKIKIRIGLKSVLIVEVQQVGQLIILMEINIVMTVGNSSRIIKMKRIKLFMVFANYHGNKTTLNIFCLRYTSGCHKKRRHLIYFVIEIFTEPYALEEIVRDKNKIITITQHINKIYKQIKTNEHSPGTDYLYQNMKSSNLEKTIAKLETMNNLGAEYIPRIE